MSHFAAFGLGALFVALVGLAGVFVFLAGAGRHGRKLDEEEFMRGFGSMPELAKFCRRCSPFDCTCPVEVAATLEELGAQELEQRVDGDSGEKGAG